MSAHKSATPLGKVRGLGSAHHGGEHWLRERLVSAALLLLGLWFVVSLMLLPALDRTTLIEWLRAPTAAVPIRPLVGSRRSIVTCAGRSTAIDSKACLAVFHTRLVTS